jgi:hypothetical protein
MRREAISTLAKEGVYGWEEDGEGYGGEEKEKRKAEELWNFSDFSNTPYYSRYGHGSGGRSQPDRLVIFPQQ